MPFQAQADAQDVHAANIAAAAKRLWLHRQTGSVLNELPANERPRDKAAAHAIQAALPGIAGQAVVGWKIAATGEAGQKHINVSGPLAGRILASFVHDDGAVLSLAGIRMRVAEPEFAFRFARSLTPRPSHEAPYSVSEVMAAVGTLHPALEIPDSRYAVFTQVGEAQLIADDACCGRFVLGAAAPAAWRDVDLREHRVRGTVHAKVDGADSTASSQPLIDREGTGQAVLGDPRVALTWLVNELTTQLHLSIEVGQFVSTGTCMVPLAIAPGDTVRADFGAFGRVQASFSDV
jgi:2-keto-4-pentenoate hydratase